MMLIRMIQELLTPLSGYFGDFVIIDLKRDGEREREGTLDHSMRVKLHDSPVEYITHVLALGIKLINNPTNAHLPV